MALSRASLILALFVTLFVAIPIAIAVAHQRGGPAVQWLKLHIRWLWGLAALSWSANLLTQFYLPDSPYRWIHLGYSVVGFLSALGAVFLMGPPPETSEES